MPNRPFIIEAFRNLPGTIEIIGLGDVRQPRGGAQEAEISVLVSSGADLLGAGAQTMVLHIGCGQLDLLVPGSRWCKGRMVGDAQSHKVSGKFEFVRNEAIGEAKASRSVFSTKGIEHAPGFLLKRVSNTSSASIQVTSEEQPDLMLLPHIELLRALFGVSSGLLLEMFDGIRNPSVSGERGLINRGRSALLDHGTVRLVAGRNLSRHEALIAAALIADSRVRRLHDSVFQALSANRDWRDGRSVCLNLDWPWAEPISLELQKRWIQKTNGKWRFIVTRIMAIGMPLPFDRIEIRHPGAESGEDDGLPPPEGRLRSANASTLVLTAGRAATPSRRPVEIGTVPVELSSASGIKIVSVLQGGQQRQDRSGIGENVRDEAPVGTGGRQSGPDVDVGHAVVKRTGSDLNATPARSIEKALDATWRALHACCSEKQWILDALPDSKTASAAEPHGGLDLAKEPLVARITIGSNHVLVVDRGSPTGDECSLGILVPRAVFGSDRKLGTAARKLCKSVNGRWRSRHLKESEFNVTPINRASKLWDDSNAYAELLGRRIAAVLGG